MEFDREKVVSFMTYEAAKWCGYMGFYANSLPELRKIVENYDRRRYGMLVIVDCDCENLEKPFGINWKDSQCPDGDCDVIAEYFYPVERKKESEKRYRPYRSLTEMVVCETFFDEDDLLEPWKMAEIITATTLLPLRKKDGDHPFLFGRITAVNLRTDEVVIVLHEPETVDLDRLFSEWQWANGKPCGAKIEEGDES